MSDVIIEVEKLGKKYLLAHQSAGKEGLRHVLQDAISAPFRKLAGLGKKSLPAAKPEGDSIEEFWAVKDVSFQIKRGDVVGIVGRNGAGKSTLLKLLSRITEPTTGRIHLKGRVASLLEVGTGFHPELTGRENIFLNGAILGMSRVEIKSKFDEIVAFSEVEKFLDTPVKRYSSGMYVRLAFAVAAHLEPEILIVDEVLAVGDAQFQRKCLGKMQEVSTSQGRTVLFVSHQLAAVRRLCRSAILMQKGETTGVTTVETALTTYTRDAKETPPTLDLSGLRRGDICAGGVKFLAVSLSPQQMQYGEPLTITFKVHAERETKGLVLGFCFDTLEGSRVATFDSDNSSPPFDLGPGVHTVSLVLDRNPVTPATYSCGAALFSGKTLLDVLANFASWEVHPGHTDRGFAGTRPPLRVEIAKAA